MSAASEQMLASLNWASVSKAEELKKRIWFTMLALIVYRLGAYIPLPGVDPAVVHDFARQNAGGLLGMFDMLSGGALGRMTIFALNVFPYISASIIVQLMTAIHPHFEALKKEGETGRKKMNQYTRYGTVLLAAVQGYGIAALLEREGAIGTAALNPGWFFEISTVVTLVGSTLFLMWLGEQITARGIGNGISLIIFSGIVANLPQQALATLELGRTGAMSYLWILLILVMAVLVIAFIVFVEKGQRRVLIQYPKRQAGAQVVGGESTHLPLKINNAGVIPPIFASSLLTLPMTVGQFSTDAVNSGWFGKAMGMLQHGTPLFLGLFVVLIVFFSFFYTSLVFNPDETAENLKKSGGFIPGIRPGKSTSDYFDFILTRLTVVGAAYLCFLCVLPDILMKKFSLPFYFGGTSLLIVVSVTMDTVAQIHSHLIAHQYEGLIKKFNKRKGRL
jgi:preprotein translocase subunit SecY